MLKNQIVGNKQIYLLKLFVTTYSTSSQRAIRNIQALLLENPNNNLKLKIIDILKEPRIAIKENIIAVPLLMKGNGNFHQKLVGDMSNRVKVQEWLSTNSTQI